MQVELEAEIDRFIHKSQLTTQRQ